MPSHHTITVAGRITHIFGHRFVVQTDRGPILADVTPKGIEQIELHIGDTVELEGEAKPSELKVTRFSRDGKTIAVEHKKQHHEHHGEADPRDALRAAKAAGFATHGEPRRKPKHFEVLGERDAHFTELHIELDGHIRKMKPADRHDPKWAHAIGA
jgi:hypothetical protein